MRKLDIQDINLIRDMQVPTNAKPKTMPGFRKQMSLPCFTYHINQKQLYPCKSWNELARQTEEKKQKRKLNNELKNELEKFFEGDEILMEPSRGSKLKNNRSNRRMSTEKNQSHSKSSLKKSSESLGRQNKPTIKPQIKQINFVPRKGVKPTHFLADLEIEDSSSEAFRSMVPQSPNQPSFAQRSTPKQTPRSHIVPSRLNSNKNADSNSRQENNNRYTEPDSPVDLLQPLRSEGSEQDVYIDKMGPKYSEYVYNSIKSAQEALLRSKDEPIVWRSTGASGGYLKSDIEKDVVLDKLSHQKNIEMLKQMQKRLGFQKDYDQNFKDQEYDDIQIQNVEYLKRPNQLQIIDEVEDQRSFNVHKDSDDGKFRSIPLSVVEEKVQSDNDQNKQSSVLVPVRYSIDGGPVLLEDFQQLNPLRKKSNSLRPSVDSEQKLIRQCSSKELFKNDEVKSQNNKVLPEPPYILSQSFKKKQFNNNGLEISHSSASKQQQYILPTLNVFAASIHQKPVRYIPNQVFDMSPIERSKASGNIHDQNDSSISKQFGNDWFTPKHQKKSQSIQKLSPIYDKANNVEQQKSKDKQINKVQSNQNIDDIPISYPLKTFPSFSPLPSAIPPVNNLLNTNAHNHLSIKYPQPSNLIDKNQHHTLKVYRKSDLNKPIPNSAPQINLKEYTYTNISTQNNLPTEQSSRYENAFKKTNTFDTVKQYCNNKNNYLTEQIKDDPIKEISRKFSIDFTQLNFPSRIDYSSAVLNITPTKIPERSNTSYVSNQKNYQPLCIPSQLKNISFNSFTVNASPLHRPHNNIDQTHRNSSSAKKGRGLRLWINNYNQHSERSKSPLQQRLSSIKKKMSLERMKNLGEGIFKSRSKSKSVKVPFYSPEKNSNKNESQNVNSLLSTVHLPSNRNLGSFALSPQHHSDRKQSIASPVRSIIRLGKRGSITELSSPRRNIEESKTTDRKQVAPKSGIKLSCEFKKHKYQQKGVVKYLNGNQ